jgi:hypothetical protein
MVILFCIILFYIQETPILWDKNEVVHGYVSEFYIEKTKENFQIYTPNAVKNGNLWDNVSSASFWTNEGIDGAGFLLSALAPGAALKALNVGAKTARLLGSTSKLAENIDIGLATGVNTFYEAGSEALEVKKNLDGQFNDLIKNQVINEFPASIQSHSTTYLHWFLQ